MRQGMWRNWYEPSPRGHYWLGAVTCEPRPSVKRFNSKEAAERQASEDAAALGQSVRYMGAFKRRPPQKRCETCNDWGWHPADGGAYPCPDCTRLTA